MDGDTASLSIESGDTNENKWSNQMDFIFTLVSTIIGFGNVWSLPYRFHVYGSGTFLMCYMITSVFIAFPLFYLECVLGQFSSKPNIAMLKSLAPAFAGIAWVQVLVAITITAMESNNLGVTLFYFVQSFSTELPWTICQEKWGDSCITISNVTMSNATEDMEDKIFSEELYYFDEVLRVTCPCHGIGELNLETIIYQLIVWSIIFGLVMHPITIIGRTSYFFAIFPSFFVILFTRRIQYFKGAAKGIKKFLTSSSDRTKFFSLKMWLNATFLSLFTLNMGTGCISTLASHNHFNYHIKGISATIIFLDMGTIILFGIMSFAIQGHVNYLIKQGEDEISFSFAFITYPQALYSIRNATNLYAITFYFMIFTISIGNVRAHQLTIMRHISYYFPRLKIWHSAAITCTICFAYSILYSVSGTIHLKNLVTAYGEELIKPVILIMFLLIVNCIYGLQNFCWDVEYMSQKEIKFFWRICWSIIVPLAVVVTGIDTYIRHFKEIFIDIHPIFPAIGLTHLTTFLSLLFAILLYEFWKNKGVSFHENLRKMFNYEKWRPFDDKYYEEWKSLKAPLREKMDERNDKWYRMFWNVLLRKYE